MMSWMEEEPRGTVHRIVLEDRVMMRDEEAILRQTQPQGEQPRNPDCPQPRVVTGRVPPLSEEEIEGWDRRFSGKEDPPFAPG